MALFLMLAIFYLSSLVLFKLEQYPNLYFYHNISKGVESLQNKVMTFITRGMYLFPISCQKVRVAGVSSG